MDGKKMMAYILLLLGSVAARYVRKCSYLPFYDIANEPLESSEEFIFWLEEECYVHPELAAIEDAYPGTGDDKTREMYAQCVLFQRGFFTGDVLDVERFKNDLRSSDEWINGVTTCDSSLLASNQAYEYTVCLNKKCEEA